MKKNFAIVGLAGYIAPRHLQAIKETGNTVVAALDPSDSVGIIDRYFDNVHFFTQPERFDRYAEKVRKIQGKQIDFVTICSPNYLHDAHIRFAFRIGANAICEKPLVINPWNLDALEQQEKESGMRVWTVLQLRYHETILALKKEIEQTTEKHTIDLTYVTPRGNWYDVSWKGDEEKSGGVAMNIGIHFFDMLLWVFGPVQKSEVHLSEGKKMSGYLELEKANVRWFLSTDKQDLKAIDKDRETPYRSLTINEKEIDFSKGFADLHTVVYKNILAGNGYGTADARPSIELVHDIRKLQPKPTQNMHPLAKALLQ